MVLVGAPMGVLVFIFLNDFERACLRAALAIFAGIFIDFRPTATTACSSYSLLSFRVMAPALGFKATKFIKFKAQIYLSELSPRTPSVRHRPTRTRIFEVTRPIDPGAALFSFFQTRDVHSFD